MLICQKINQNQLKSWRKKKKLPLSITISTERALTKLKNNKFDFYHYII